MKVNVGVRRGVKPRAVQVVLEAQQVLAAKEWGGLDLSELLRVRMALHVGAVDPEPACRVEQAVARDDPQSKALACYGL